jgi:hypothetical protein
MRRYSRIGPNLVGMALLVGGLHSANVYAAPPESDTCSRRIVVELTPDVPNPRDPQFLSSLVGNHPAYQLYWLRPEGSFGNLLELIGPGPDRLCQSVIASLRKAGRVLSVRPEHEEHLDTVAIVSKLDAPENDSSVRISREGLGSVLWAAGHPTQAWQILLPVWTGDPTGAYEDASAECLTMQESPDDPAACP